MDVLPRHAARRAGGIPTVTVMVGPPGSARRMWQRWVESTGSPMLECTSEPLRHLREWAILKREDLARVMLESLGRRSDRDVEWLVRHWPQMTRADMDAFWNAVPPETGDDTLRTFLDPTAPLPAGHGIAEALQLPAFGAARPSLFAIVDALENLTAWAAFAERHPTFAIAVATSADVWNGFLSKPAITRPEAIIREGELKVPTLDTEEVVRRLVAGGLPEKAAKALAQSAHDAAFVEEVIALFKNTATKPSSKDADDQARSNAERYIFARLEDLAETKGRFQLNTDKRFDSGKSSEIDLVCEDPKIAIEVDGYFHFRSDQDYRNDRDKDWELQRHGYIVLRFLAEDVTRHWDVVRDRIFAALKRNEQ